MIVVDLNQVLLADLFVALGGHTNAKIEISPIRHLLLNTLRATRRRFTEEYGEVVIACDNARYWRRDVFPYYKAGRRAERDKSDLDWKAVFECFHQLRAELDEVFPYRLVDVPLAEADDVIAVLAREYHEDEPVLIVSGDKDFRQLQRLSGVRQYDPGKKAMIKEDDPEGYLLDLVLGGDPGDGIPNVMSDDDAIVNPEKKQRQLTQKRRAMIKAGEYPEPEGDIRRNIARNRQLIDFDYIPRGISDAIVESYTSQEGTRGRTKLFDYFVDNRLRNLMTSIQDF